MRSMKISLLAAVALTAFVAPAFAETVEVKTGAASVNQVIQSTSNQVAGATAAANGEIRNNSSVKAIAANTANTSDIDNAIEATGASHNVTGSLSASFGATGNEASNAAGNAASAANSA